MADQDFVKETSLKAAMSGFEALADKTDRRLEVDLESWAAGGRPQSTWVPYRVSKTPAKH